MTAHDVRFSAVPAAIARIDFAVLVLFSFIVLFYEFYMFMLELNSFLIIRITIPILAKLFIDSDAKILLGRW